MLPLEKDIIGVEILVCISTMPKISLKESIIKIPGEGFGCVEA